MRKSIAKHFGYPLQDFIKGTDILGIRDFLIESQYWEKEKIEEYQFSKLKKLIQHAYLTVSYYKDLFNKYGIKPDDIKDFSDVKKIPVLTKDIARKEYKNMVSSKINWKYVTTGRTGGTTGPPLTTYTDTNTRSFVWGAYYRWYQWMGINIGDPITTLWGAAVTHQSRKRDIKIKTVNWLQNIDKINSFKMNEDSFPTIIKKIESHKPRLIKGYVSAMLDLARFLDKKKIRHIQPIAISTTSETLLPVYRKYIEEVFNCKIFDQYGCGECESIAYECASHNGLHVVSEHVYLEILNNQNENAFFDQGKIVITDLDNFAMPFIRYENGDSSCISKDQCSCGIKHPILKSILGRVADTIVLKDGSAVHAVFFTIILSEISIKESEKVNRFQVFQKKAGEIEFRLEYNFNLEDKFINDIENALYKYFTKVEIKILKEIHHDKTGKFRYIISNIQNK